MRRSALLGLSTLSGALAGGATMLWLRFRQAARPLLRIGDDDSAPGTPMRPAAPMTRGLRPIDDNALRRAMLARSLPAAAVGALAALGLYLAPSSPWGGLTVGVVSAVVAAHWILKMFELGGIENTGNGDKDQDRLRTAFGVARDAWVGATFGVFSLLRLGYLLGAGAAVRIHEAQIKPMFDQATMDQVEAAIDEPIGHPGRDEARRAPR